MVNEIILTQLPARWQPAPALRCHVACRNTGGRQYTVLSSLQLTKPITGAGSTSVGRKMSRLKKRQLPALPCRGNVGVGFQIDGDWNRARVRKPLGVTPKPHSRPGTRPTPNRVLFTPTPFLERRHVGLRRQ